MNKHTPGPWFVSNENLIRSEKNRIAQAWLLRSKEGRANVRLIAAAPDLLEALEKLLADFESVINNEYDGTNALNGILAEVDYARAAIAKARGAE